ncbi:hypothetical protein B0H21DRAFT_858676 [Amylocystis lapponica]|nr:hypothetical protein B0H21DRAFT_858676 [Amylocystis lapponica]
MSTIEALQHLPLSPDASALAGFFGGDDAVAAMAMLHAYQGRKWLGWYNSPGSYEIAKRLTQLATSRLCDGPSPSTDLDPAILLGSANSPSPAFIAAHSGSVIPHTGPCADLFLHVCRTLAPQQIPSRESRPMTVTIADLTHAPSPHTHPTLAPPPSALLALLPTAASLAAAAGCAYTHDWLCCALIALGIAASASAALALAFAAPTFARPPTAPGAPTGSGVLLGPTDTDVAVLRGPEGAVSAITRGHFALHPRGAPALRLSAVLHLAQAALQLLLVPQGTRAGQALVLASLAAAWAYNAHAAAAAARWQGALLVRGVLRAPRVRRFALGSRTAMAVFVLLVLRPARPEGMLAALLPNDTGVWVRWRAAVAGRVAGGEALVFGEADWDVEGLDADERRLLQTLLGDAQAAYEGYVRYVAPEIAPTESVSKA